MEADHRFARVAQDPRFKASLEVSCFVWLPFICLHVSHIYIRALASRSIEELAFPVKSSNVCSIGLLLFSENLAKREEA